MSPSLILAFALVTLGAAAARAATYAQALDPTFAAGGIAQVPFGLTVENASLVRTDPQGRVVVVGNGTPDFTTYPLLVVRLLPDGSLDPSFGASGRLSLQVGASPLTMAIQPDSKIIVGATFSENSHGTGTGLLRLNTDGSLDSSFGTGGLVRFTGDTREQIRDLALQPDGAIVCLSYGPQLLQGLAYNSYAVRRYSFTGVLDTSFATGGKFTPAARFGFVPAIALQSDGCIVASGFERVVEVVGDEFAFGPAYPFVFRLTGGGQLDTSFGDQGYAYLPSDNSGGITHEPVLYGAPAVSATGRIVVTSYNSQDLLLFALTPQGAMDSTFGTAGVARLTTGHSLRVFRATVGPNGKIFAAGPGKGLYDDPIYEGPSPLVIASFDFDGVPDPTFWGTGMVTVESTTESGVFDLAVQGDGKPLVIATGVGTGFRVGRFRTSAPVGTHAPVASSQSAGLASNTALTPSSLPITLSATDADGESLTYSIVSGPAHGSLTTLGAGDTTTYTPAANYVGPDSFTFKASDGATDSNTATVTLLVTNRAPAGTVDDYTVAANSQLYVPVAQGVLANDADPEGQYLQAVLVQDVAHGVLHMGADGWFLYTPSVNYAGTDSFTYRVYDPYTSHGPVTVIIHVPAVPVGVAQSVTVASNTTGTPTSLPVTLAASDLDGDALTYSIVSGPSHGTLGAVSGAGVTYTPVANYTGADSFTFRAYDGTYWSSPAAVSITVVNRAPTAAADSYSVRKNSQIYVGTAQGLLANDTDPEHQQLHSALVSGTTHGVLNLSADGWFLYTPAPGYSGPDCFTYQAYDSFGGRSVTTVVTITVTSP